MKIKRYTAASMRAALALVRAEQGPDAVILSSRRGEDGIEVIAAVDYDEALFADAKRQRPRRSCRRPAWRRRRLTRLVPVAPAHRSRHRIARGRLNAAPRNRSADAAPRQPRSAARARGSRAPAGYGAMQRELQDLRRLLETGLAGMTWSDKRLREPLQGAGCWKS